MSRPLLAHAAICPKLSDNGHRKLKKIAHFLTHEIRRGLPAFMFFFVAFHMMSLTKAISVSGFNITLFTASVATVGALIVTKAILLADHSRLANVFSNHLIADVVWKTTVFMVLATIFKVIEEFIHAWVNQGGFSAGWAAFSSSFDAPYFVVIEMWLMFLLLLYCLIARLFTIIGRDKYAA